MINKRSYKNGFTLTELLIVIAILAVLAAIAIPSIAGLIDRANVSSDKTNAKEMTNAIERFTAEYELYKQDIASGKIKDINFDAAQGRVYNVTGITDINGVRGVENIGFTNNVQGIDLDTKYPVNELTTKSVIENYLKTDSSTFEPKQSDHSYYYSPQVGIVIVAPTGSPSTDLDEIAKVSGVDYATVNAGKTVEWINLSINANKPVNEWTNVVFATMTQDVYYGYRLDAPCFDITWTTEYEDGTPAVGVSHNIAIKNLFHEAECNTPGTMESVPAGRYELRITDEDGYFYDYSMTVYKEGMQKFSLETPSGRITIGCEPPVHDGNIEDGTYIPEQEPQKETISFMLNDKMTYANKNMTWNQWLDSKYNTANYDIDVIEIRKRDLTPVSFSDKIEDLGDYVLTEYKTTLQTMTLEVRIDNATVQTFTIEFLEGLTWGELIPSCYNTIGLMVYKDSPFYDPANSKYDDMIVYDYNGTPLALSSVEQCCDKYIVYDTATMPKDGSCYYLVEQGQQ